MTSERIGHISKLLLEDKIALRTSSEQMHAEQLCQQSSGGDGAADDLKGHAGKQLRRDHEDEKSSNGSGPPSNGKENGAIGIQKGDGVYYINSPEFTGGLGKREARMSALDIIALVLSASRRGRLPSIRRDF